MEAEDKRAFYTWIKKHDLKPSADYDLYSAFKAGVNPDERGHLPDTYKLPNHITYSDESIYSKKPNAPPPGHWFQENNKWYFWASPTNIQNAGGVTNLQSYFNQYEPDAGLILPNINN